MSMGETTVDATAAEFLVIDRLIAELDDFSEDPLRRAYWQSAVWSSTLLWLAIQSETARLVGQLEAPETRGDAAARTVPRR